MLQSEEASNTPALPRSALLVVALAATVAGACVYLGAIPSMWFTTWPIAAAFGALGLVQILAAAALLTRPTRARAATAAAAAGAVLAGWAITRFVANPGPNPWFATDRVIGITDGLCAALEATGAAGLLLSSRAIRPPSTRIARAAVTAATVIVALPLTIITAVGILGSTNGFASPGPTPSLAAIAALAGRPATLTYCRPRGNPLTMDIYPPASGQTLDAPVPVVVYVHGGGLVLGNRQTAGLGAALANHHGALFEPVRARLNARGLAVASVDYRLLPASRWPAPIEDVKCAIRFLRANAAALNIDPDHIGIWGSSSGAQLALLAGLARRTAGFDHGPYRHHSSSVQAVVDMFGPTDLEHLQHAAPFARMLLYIDFGRSTALRRSASPIHYVTPSPHTASNTPAFLLLQGEDDPMVPPRQTSTLLHTLVAAGFPASLLQVAHAGHGLDSTTQDPPKSVIVDQTVRFLASHLSR